MHACTVHMIIIEALIYTRTLVVYILVTYVSLKKLVLISVLEVCIFQFWFNVQICIYIYTYLSSSNSSITPSCTGKITQHVIHIFNEYNISPVTTP